MVEANGNHKVATFLNNASTEIQAAIEEMNRDLNIDPTIRTVQTEMLRAHMISIRALGLRYEPVAKR